MTRAMPPKKATMPRIRSFREKKRTVLENPMVNVNPIRKSKSPKANKAESKKKMTPKNRKTTPFMIIIPYKYERQTCESVFSQHPACKYLYVCLLKLLTNNSKPVPIFVLSLKLTMSIKCSAMNKERLW